MSAAVQFVVPPGSGTASLIAALERVLAVERDGTRAADRTFYDTFDGRLHEESLIAVHEGDRLAVLDAIGYGERASAAVGKRPASVLAADLAPGSLREVLAPLVEMRALTPLARVRSRMTALRVLDGERKTVVRLAVEEPELVAGRERRALPARVHVRPVRGYEKAFARVRRTLEDELSLTPAQAPLHDEAVALAGGRPGGVSTKVKVALRPDQRADEAAAIVAAGLLSVIEANLQGTIADVDTEFLHDLRVSVRRTRSLQRQLKEIFPAGALASFRAGFRWLQQATGEVRDLDVYLLEFEQFGSPELEPLRELLERRREVERRKMVRALTSDRASALLGGWRAFIAALPPSPDTIETVAAARISKVYRRMVKMGRAIDDDSPAEALHDLRKKGKELRYLLEFFTSIFPSEVVGPMVKSLKALQDVLGRHQDREIQAQTMRDLRDEVVKLDDGAAALMAMGLLVDRLERGQVQARAEFAERFSAFASSEQRRLVKDTFG